MLEFAKIRQFLMMSLISILTEITIEEISFKGGRAGASSVWKGMWSYLGFRTNSASVWHSGPESNPDPLPQYIWYDLRDQRICPSKISFRPRQDNILSANSQTPRKFQLVATNDAVCNQHAHWDILCQDVSGFPVTSFDDRRFCVVRHRDDMPCKQYRCIGIKVLKLGDRYASLGGIQLWAFRKTFTK